LISCIFFVGAGLAVIPRLGIEDDETLFVQALIPPRAELFSFSIGGFHVPIMLMTYVGALKSWIFHPIFGAFGAGTLSMRIPMLLAATASIWLFYLLLRRIGGERAALIGCALLAVDSGYLLTSCFDWGPVALQHLLTIGGVLLLVRFYQEGEERALFGGFLCLGLALWDKALATWVLSGMGLAAILVFPKGILARLNARRAGLAIAAFLLGALPLVIYNAGHQWDTFHGNFHRETGSISGKANLLLKTAEDGGLFGWLTEEDWKTPAPHRPKTVLQKLCAGLSWLDGGFRQQALPWLFFLALLLTPLARGDALRAILFALITGVVAWTQMAITANAGGSIHHTILLWPLPQVVIAVSLAAASRRLGRFGVPVLAAVLAVASVCGFLVINEYYAKAVRNGGSQAWDDAVFPLSRYVTQVPAKWVVCLDWGILDQLRLLDDGRLPLTYGAEQVSKPDMNEEDRTIVRRMVTEPESVYITHTKNFEFFPGNSAKLVKFAEGEGYRREDLSTISDSFGRPVFEVYKFVRQE
jgi:4-amino-4-deoxy-L-arabinose transferase-like glycosyltransferase